MPKIEVVAADLAGVMVEDGFGPVVDEYGTRYGADMDALKKAKDRLWVERLSLGRMSELEFWNQCFTEGGVELKDGQITEISEAVRVAHMPLWRMFWYFHRLREAGVTTALLTNTAMEWLNWWKENLKVKYGDETWTLSNCFGDNIYASCDPRMGVRKEDPEYFSKAALDLGVELGSIAATDDQQRNVDVECSVGMKAFLYESPNQAIAEFDRLRGVTYEGADRTRPYTE